MLTSKSANYHTLRVLYITYDGLLDPLGQSQVIPYVKAVCSMSETFHIISFEKIDEGKVPFTSVMESLGSIGIAWTWLTFTKRFGFFGKVYDLLRMLYLSIRIVKKERINLIHARSHPPAQVASILKLIFGVRFIFDFRGLWVDERVDKGGWDLSKNFDYFQYRINKILEKKMLALSDRVVVLTHAVVPEVQRLGGISDSVITVIPCCADFDHFTIPSEGELSRVRGLLGLEKNTVVIGYLGSAGGMYRTDLFFKLFERIDRSLRRVHALLLTPDRKLAEQYANDGLEKSVRDKVTIIKADRVSVAEYLPLMSIMVSFVKGGYARVSMSPTKLAESLACGVPFICSGGIGDVDRLLKDLAGGVTIQPDSDNSFEWITENLEYLINLGGEQLRRRAEPILGLNIASLRYKSVYSSLKMI